MSARVAYVCADPGIPPDGQKGASVHFRTMAAALGRVGCALDVFMARDGDLAAFAPHRARVVRGARDAAGELGQLAHQRTLLDALGEAGPHAAVYERLSLFGLAGMCHARRLGVPLVVEVNAPLWREAAAFRSLDLGNSARGVCLDVMRAATRVLAVSGALRDELIEFGVDGARVEVFGNGADVPAFRRASPAQRPTSLVGKPTLLFVGSLKPWHGIEFLVEAFTALRAVRPCGLWVVGDGPERARIAALQQAFPEDVVLHGAVPHEHMPGILQAADAVVAPYRRSAPSYFSPLKVVEVLAAGRPLLASRVPCVLATLAGHRPLGLFEADSVEDFVVAAQRVFAAGDAAARIGIDQQRVASLDWTHKARQVAALLGVGVGDAAQQAVHLG